MKGFSWAELYETSKKELSEGQRKDFIGHQNDMTAWDIGGTVERRECL